MNIWKSKKAGSSEDNTNKTPTSTSVPKPTVIGSLPVASVSDTFVTKIDYNQALDKAMDDANLPGPDYYEFAKALKALEGQPFNEAQKYTLTMPTYAAMNITPGKLVQSAKTYIGILDDEANKFKQGLTQARKVLVEAKNKEISADQQIINDLTKQIQEKTANIQKLAMEVNTNTNQLNTEEMAFNSAYSSRVNEINNHISKIQTYLTNESTK